MWDSPPYGFYGLAAWRHSTGSDRMNTKGILMCHLTMTSPRLAWTVYDTD